MRALLLTSPGKFEVREILRRSRWPGEMRAKGYIVTAPIPLEGGTF